MHLFSASLFRIFADSLIANRILGQLRGGMKERGGGGGVKREGELLILLREGRKEGHGSWG